MSASYAEAIQMKADRLYELSALCSVYVCL